MKNELLAKIISELLSIIQNAISLYDIPSKTLSVNEAIKSLTQKLQHKNSLINSLTNTIENRVYFKKVGQGLFMSKKGTYTEGFS